MRIAFAFIIGERQPMDNYFVSTNIIADYKFCVKYKFIGSW
jgi:hypothetical protein